MSVTLQQLEQLQQQNTILRQLVAIHDRLGALVLQGADAAEITRTLADLVNRRVLLLDALLQVQTTATPSRSGFERDGFTWAPRQGYVRAVLATLARERRTLRVPPMSDFGVDASCVLAPVGVGEAILGYLAILSGPDDAPGVEDLDLQIVQHAANVYALSMMRERMAADVSRQLKDELFEGLLLGRTQDEEVARERAARLGLDPGVGYRAVVMVASTSESAEQSQAMPRLNRLLESLAQVVVRRVPDAKSTVRSDELVVLLPEVCDAREVGRAAVQHAASLLPEWRVMVGISGRSESASGIARAYAQARRALETAQRFGQSSDVVAFDELGVYRLLFHVEDPNELRGFTDKVLGPLIEYDERHNAELVATLGAYLDNNGNLQATARELSLHVNSVAYRVQRIRNISGLDLEDSEDRLLAQVALKILNTR